MSFSNSVSHGKVIGKIAKQHALAVFGLVVIAVCHSWPLLSQFTVAIPGTADFADVTEYVWNTGYIRKALTSDASLFFTDTMFVPFGADLKLNTFGLLQGLLAFPLTFLFGVVGAYNLVLIFTYILNGVVTYALFQHQVKNRTAAFVSAGWFMLGQSVLGQINFGRSALGAIWIVSGTLLLFITLIDKPKLWKGVALGIMLVLALLTDFQIVLFSGLWLLFYGVYQLAILRQQFFQRERLLSILLAIGIFMIPFLWLYFPSLVGAETNGYRIPTFNGMLAYSFTLRGYARPTLWWVIAGSYMFAVAFVAALLIFRWRRPYRFWFVSVLIFMLLALGPYLQPTEFPLPFAALGAWTPFRQFRTPARLLLPAMIGFGMIAAYVLAYLIPFIRSRLLLMFVIVIAIGLQFWFAQSRTPFVVQQYPTYEIYEQIGAESADFTLLEVPFSIRSGLRRFGWHGEVVQYYQHIHNKPLLSGSMARLPTAYFEYYEQFPSLQFLTGEKSTVDEQELMMDFADVLDWSNSRYVLLHRSLLTEAQAENIEAFLDASPDLSRIGVQDDLIIYRRADT